jgi:uncharacterized membrane protein YeaQ/YmgE (transglycosylase-associated protein family)
MIFLWLLLMGLFVAWMAVPLARRVGYGYGRFGRTGDILLVVGGALLGGVVLVVLLRMIGQEIGDTGALLLGFLGAMVAVVLLALFSASSAAVEPDAGRQTPPAHQIDDTETVYPTTRPGETTRQDTG